LEQLLGVKLYPSSKNDLRYLFDHQQRKPLSIEDIQYYDVRVKTLSIIRYADGISHTHTFVEPFFHLYHFRSSSKEMD
jgi:hypothetical protein